MGKLFIVGTGSHARKIYHYALALGYEVAEFVDENIAALSPILNVGVSHAASLLAPLNGEVMFDVGSIVDHDCQVGEYSHLKAGCILQAYASIGNTPPEQ